MDEQSAALIRENTGQLRQLVEKFKSYQLANVDLHRVMYFISQFKTYSRVKVMLGLLNQIDFIDSARMTSLLRRAYNKIDPKLRTRALISSLGTLHDSSAVVCYQLLKQLFDEEKEGLHYVTDLNSIGSIITSTPPSAIIFFDDNITSGTQLSAFFEELIDGKRPAEMVKVPLTPAEHEALKKIPVRICYAVQLGEDAGKIVNELRTKYGLDIAICAGKYDLNNHLEFGSGPTDSEEEAKFARDFTRELAEPLYADKMWPPETVYSRLLGYGNLGKLTVFYYNVPKSLVPVFWKFGYINGVAWLPLFPETQEVKKIEKAGAGFDYLHSQLVKGWMAGERQLRKPDIVLGMDNGNGPATAIKITVPPAHDVETYFQSVFPLRKLDYDAIEIVPKRHEIQAMLENIYPSAPNNKLTDDEYEKYKRAVDDYNEKKETFYGEAGQYIIHQASNSQVTFVVTNNGNTAATHCTVKLEYNTGELLLDEFEDMERPAFSLDVPKIDRFNTARHQIHIITAAPHHFEIGNLLGHKKKAPFEKDKSYTCKIFDNIRVGHNDSVSETVTVTRMNLAKQDFELPYEINFEEEAETISGVLHIHFEPTAELSATLREELRKSIEKFK